MIVWSTQSARQITIFDMHHSVQDLQISFDAGHVVVMLEGSTHLPMLCLHNSPATDVKSQTYMNMTSDAGTQINFDGNHTGCVNLKIKNG